MSAQTTGTPARDAEPIETSANAEPTQVSADGTYWWDGSAWRPVSPDRRWWWDGFAWRALPAPSGIDSTTAITTAQSRQLARQARDAARRAQKAAEQAARDERRRIEVEARAKVAAEREERRKAEQAAAQARVAAETEAAAKAVRDRQTAIDLQVAAALAGEPLPAVTKFYSDDQRYRWSGGKWKSFDVAREAGFPVGAVAGGERLFIARPDRAKGDLIFKWPDKNLRKWSQVTVEADELVVFFRDGIAQYVLPPGRWTLDSYELPILSGFLDARTGGKLFLTELYFVTIREVPNLAFSGLIDNVVDPQSNIAVSLRAGGSYSLKVTDPKVLITRLAGTGAADSMTATTSWVSGILMKVLRTEVVEEILAERWPMLGIVQHSDEIEAQVLQRVAPHLQPYGLSIVRFGDFLVELPPPDVETLKSFSKDIQYSRLAGGYGQYSVGKAMQGVGEGAAQGGSASGPALLGLGLNLGGLAQSAIGVAGTSTQVVRMRCPSCHELTDETGAFCSRCGASLKADTPQLSASGWKCPSCQHTNEAGSVYCSQCGSQGTKSTGSPGSA